MFKKYLDYYKDNPEGYWFKRKIWGWGYTPVKWQGWFLTVLYLVLVAAILFTREAAVVGDPDSGSNFLVFGLPLFLLTCSFIYIVYKKGEKPRWQWGLPKDK